VIGWQAELALCDWLVESRDPAEGTRVFPSLPLCPLQLDPGVAGIRTVCRELQRRGGGCKEEELQPLLV